MQPRKKPSIVSTYQIEVRGTIVSFDGISGDIFVKSIYEDFIDGLSAHYKSKIFLKDSGIRKDKTHISSFEEIVIEVSEKRDGQSSLLSAF